MKLECSLYATKNTEQAWTKSKVGKSKDRDKGGTREGKKGQREKGKGKVNLPLNTSLTVHHLLQSTPIFLTPPLVLIGGSFLA